MDQNVGTNDSQPTNTQSGGSPVVPEGFVENPVVIPVVEPAPSMEFLPYVDEVEERKNFWKTVIITFLIFTGISTIGMGYVVSQRLSQPSPKIDIQYVDGAPDLSTTPVINITRKPTRTPSPVQNIPTIGGGTNPSTIPGPSSAVAPTSSVPFIVFSTATPTPIPALIPTSATVATPTVSSTYIPTVTSDPLRPTVTPYLFSSADTVNFGTVEVGTSKGVVFQLMNLGGLPLTISEIFFSTTGDNIYTLSNGGDGSCITNTNVPLTLGVNTTKCISVHFKPTSTSYNSSTLIIRWNITSMKSITLVGSIPVTPTPSPTITTTPSPHTVI